MIVSKFGGSSVALPSGAQNIKSILNKDKNIKFVVVSAIGKRGASDVKVTDELFTVYQKFERGEDFLSPLKSVICKYQSLADDLKVKINFDLVLKKILKEIKQQKDVKAFIVSRGEYLSALVYSKFLKLKFLDAKDYIIFTSAGKINEKETRQKLGRLDMRKRYILGGFYGSYGGKIVLFSRGGSDVTGALIAKALCAEEYENFTDVEGVYTCNPNLYSFSTQLPILEYNDAIKLASLGSEIIHNDALNLLKDTNVLLRVKNSFSPIGRETLIVKNAPQSFSYMYLCTQNVFVSVKQNYEFNLKDVRVIKNKNNYLVLSAKNLPNENFLPAVQFVIFCKNSFENKRLKNLKKIKKLIKNYCILAEFLTINNNFTIICESKFKHNIIQTLNANLQK